MTTRTWETQRQAWERIPFDDVGYVSAADILKLPDHEVLRMARQMEYVRYIGWRNHRDLWRLHMGLDSIRGRRVLDYGCGWGIEALQYAKNSNAVSIADINWDSVRLAERVLRLHGFAPWSMLRIGDGESAPKRPGSVSALDQEYDLVVMNGVLHHIENPLPAVEEAHRVLDAGGELRVMVYTDVGWRLATRTEPPEDVAAHPAREQFVRWGDEVGDWADWYNGDRLEQRFGHLFRLREWHYITHEDRYGIGIMEKL